MIDNNVTIERRNGHRIEMRTIKRPEFIELSIDTWIYLDEMSLYIVVAEMCMHHRVYGIYERLYAIKSQYYHWYAAEFNVLADNFVVCQLISMSIGSLAS